MGCVPGVGTTRQPRANFRSAFSALESVLTQLMCIAVSCSARRESRPTKSVFICVHPWLKLAWCFYALVVRSQINFPPCV